MTPRRQPKPENGFTLIEVMLAAAVMLAGIVGMIQAIASGSEMLDVSRNQTIATQIIHGEIEKIHVSDWAQVSALPPSGTVALNSSFASISQGFQCTRAVADIPGRTDFKQVTYTVTWTSNTGRSHSRASSTYVGKNGL